MSNTALIEKFYTAFAHADAELMVSCYTDDIAFEDPAFGPLYGDDAKNMWRMLVNPGLQLVFSKVWADENKGGAHWEATYTFSKTGRRVVNKIDASFEFRDGLISKHTDKFSFWKWAAQALSLPGKLLGWTPALQQKVRQQALERLKNFSKK
jgi:ketosteroid isomerase-like protein